MNLKDRYSPTFFNHFKSYASRSFPKFQEKAFDEALYSAEWKELELKDRMRHIAKVMKNFVDESYELAMGQWVSLFNDLRADKIQDFALEYMFINEFISQNGLNHLEVSLHAMSEITEITSCEFAIREFLKQEEAEALEIIYTWVNHDNHHVRRLASEGTRPILPWSFPLKSFKKNPQLTLPILEKLKNDEYEYVRRSVANHINDISKDHPDLVIETMRKWLGRTKELDWVCKHGSRTLLKKGIPEILNLFGFGDPACFKLDNFKLQKSTILKDQDLYFVFEISNGSKSKEKLRLEYAIYYLKSNGSHSKKVFQISERFMDSQEKITIQKKQSFKDLSTRKHYAGNHFISLITNGVEREKLAFEYIK